MNFVFDRPHALEINRARLEHLASLGLDLAKLSILEVGSGIGLLTGFFEQLECSVLSTDARPENVQEHRKRHPNRRVEIADLSIPGSHDIFGRFDVVFCYGTLYHLSNPGLAICDLAKVCKGIILLETCVHATDNGQINPVPEPTRELDQSFEGMGCRPARDWVFSELKKYFQYVYVTASQPNHPNYPLHWPADSAKNCRSVFIASSKPLYKPSLLDQIPNTQYPFIKNE